MRKIKIISTGKYLPKKIVSGIEIDRILGLSEGRSAQMSGVESRHYVEDESASEMGAYALMAALEKSIIAKPAMVFSLVEPLISWKIFDWPAPSRMTSGDPA